MNELIIPIAILALSLLPNTLTTTMGNPLKNVNSGFKSIERALEKGSYTSACKYSVQTKIFINRNIETLKELEPNYNWVQIINLLKRTSKQLCQINTIKKQ